MTSRFLDEALDEALDAARRYAEERDGLDLEFLDELRRVVDVIGDHPERFPIHPKSSKRRPFRILGLDRFPFHVIYLVEGDEVVIYAVSHHHRRPGYWLRRRG